MSQLRTNAILDASGGTTATVNGYAPSLSNMAGRNRIINGDMRIDQRNAGASVAVTTAGQYTLDRWAVASPSSFGGQLTAQRSATAPTGFTNSLSLTATTADASIGATEYYAALQRIEGHNVADFGWGASGASTVTLSFWVRASIAGTYSGSFRNGASDRSYVFEYSVLSANTWEYKIVVITGDTTGTWVKDSGVGIDLWWSVGTGSTYQSATVGAWQDGVYLASTNQTQLIGTLNATWQITGVQLEAGSIATPFERRLYGDELARCQRYYERITETNTTETIIGIGMAYSSTRVLSRLDFLVEKRVNPTVSVSGVSHVQPLIANGSHVSPTGVSFLTNTRGCRMDMTGLSGLAVAACAEVRFNPDATNPNISIDAEL